MDLTVEALSPAEGVGIVRVGKTLRLVRPPYRLSDAPQIPDDELKIAVLKHDFFASDKRFDSWREVIDFLNNEVLEVRKRLGRDVPDAVNALEVLEVAPDEVLRRFLDRVENELIPERLFDSSEAFLVAFLASTASTRDAQLTKRAAQLLARNKEQRDAAQAVLRELSSHDVRFECLEKDQQLEKSTRLTEIIRERGSVFAACS